MQLSEYPARIFQFLKSNFYEDYYDWVLWPIASYAFGIMFYFSLKIEPSVLLTLTCFVTSLLSLLFFKRNPTLRIVLTLLSCFFLGISISTYRTQSINFTRLEEPIDKARLVGRIEKVYPLIVGTKIILSDVKVYKHSPICHPRESGDPVFNPTTRAGLDSRFRGNDIGGGNDIYGNDNKKCRSERLQLGKVQVTVKTKGDEHRIGDYISLYASLQPVSLSIFPGKYDFARHAYFDQIAAMGFAVSKIKLIRPAKALRISEIIERLRWKILDKINNQDVKNPGIIAALMIGEQKAIDKTTITNMRNSGLTHILSVSGMHLSLVSIICFFVIRYTLSNFVFFAQNYNTKKIAAWVSLLATFGYLLISGLQIAAIRSFIMVAFIIIAVILDREDDARRSVCFAALLILLVTPEAILHPSFQMSFSAVLALVSLYGIYSKATDPTRNLNLLGKIVAYFIGVLSSSFTAGLATAMFVIYHFNNYSNYSVIANLLAAALVSLIIMPGVIITFLLLPFGNAYKVGTYFMDIGIDFMVKIATYVSNLPKAIVMLPPISVYVLITFVFGFLWLCLWQAKWRFLGFAPILIALILLFTADFPSIILDSKYKTVLMRDQDSLLTFTGKKRLSKWHTDQWSSIMNISTIDKFEPSSENYVFDYMGYKLELNFEYDAQNNPKLKQAKIYDAINEAIITKEDLETKGSYFIYLKPHNLSVKYTIDNSIKRPWS